MPRSRSIKRAPRRSSKKQSKLSFLSENTQAFIARRLVDGFSLALFGAGAFTLVGLSTYSNTDPSWNTAALNNADIQNWAGASGAWLSDMLLQTMGAGSFIIGAGLCALGTRAYKRSPMRPLSFRLVALALASLCTSIAMAKIPAGSWSVNTYLGSTFGSMLLTKINALSPSLSNIAVPITASIIALTGFLYACAVKPSEIRATLSLAKHTIIGLALFTYNLCSGFLNWISHHNEPGYQPEWPTLFSFDQLKDWASAIAIENKEPVSKAPKISKQAAYKEPEKTRTSDFVETRHAPARSNAPIPVVTHEAPKQSAQSANEQTRFHLPDGDWELPSLGLLEEIPAGALESKISEDALRKNAELLKQVLEDFKVEGDIVSIHPGPVVTLYELEPAPGTKSSRIIGLADDIARSMSAVSVRVAVVPGRNVIGIELPNNIRQTVYMREMLTSKLFEKSKAKLPLILGKDIGGQPVMADLAKMPHLLVAGTTGSGKSVAVNTMLLSLLYRLPPEKCRLIMIDPKMLELSIYDDIPHLLSPVVTEPGQAIVALKWTVQEMEDRYRAMSKLGVRNIEGYNTRMREAQKSGEILTRKVQTGFDPDTGKPIFEEQAMDLQELPYIVVVVDEFADLMLVAGKDVENAIQRLAQMARAAGIHLIMATQRPSVDVITGVIKANFPTRISFSVTSKIDSRTILGEGGAEQLLGMGDMLYMAPGGRITRVHGPFVSDKDVESVTNFLRSQSEPLYIDAISSGDGDFGDNDVLKAMFGDDSGDNSVDELYDQAVALVAREGKASTSFVQRYLQIGYNRAARIIEEMERQGIISAASKTGKREILVRDFSDF